MAGNRKNFKKLVVDPREIDYKNVELLRRFLDSNGKILALRMSGLKQTVKNKIKSAIKRARCVGLLPLVNAQSYFARLDKNN